MVSLKAFPGTVHGIDFGIDVEVERRSQELSLVYVVEGKYQDLKIPPVSASPQRKDFLWEHTCFEVFLAEAQSSSYEEWNFSPSGDFAHYRFENYRHAISGLSDLEPYELSWIELSSRQAQLSVLIPLPQTVELDLGLSAVIEMRSGQKSFWALDHTSAKPDFHVREHFKLRI